MDQGESPGGAGMKNSPGTCQAVLMPRRMRGRESIHASGFGWVLRAAFNCQWNRLTMPLV